MDGGTLRRALGFVMAGMLLVVGDVAINGHDLLPDALGWLFVAGALHGIRHAHPDPRFAQRMTAAWLLAWAALVLSFVHAPWLGFVVSLAQPIATAYGLLRLATLAGEPLLRRSWEASLVALASMAALLCVLAVVREDGPAAAATVFVLGALGQYLVTLYRTRVLA